MEASRSAIRLRREVAEALSWGRPVVALESTLIAHGLPRPDNLALALELEAIVREEGGMPATIGVIGGTPVVGLDGGELERIATSGEVPKLSVRDLAPARVLGSDGATTVAGTAFLANQVGIAVMATGGLGGVHREARETWDESADLITLSRTPITVVCSGVKSMLDVGATLERLESLNVCVVGYGTRQFAGFYVADSGFALEWSVGSPAAAADLIRALMGGSALVIANPVPVEDQLDPAVHDRVLAEALAECERQGVRGKAVTPVLLDYFRTHTAGASVRTNLQLVRHNARLATRIAAAL